MKLCGIEIAGSDARLVILDGAKTHSKSERKFFDEVEDNDAKADLNG